MGCVSLDADSMRLSAASTVALVFSAAADGHWIWRGWTAYEREINNKKKRTWGGGEPTKTNDVTANKKRSAFGDVQCTAAVQRYSTRITRGRQTG